VIQAQASDCIDYRVTDVRGLAATWITGALLNSFCPQLCVNLALTVHSIVDMTFLQQLTGSLLKRCLFGSRSSGYRLRALRIPLGSRRLRSDPRSPRITLIPVCGMCCHFTPAGFLSE